MICMFVIKFNQVKTQFARDKNNIEKWWQRKAEKHTHKHKLSNWRRHKRLNDEEKMTITPDTEGRDVRRESFDNLFDAIADVWVTSYGGKSAQRKTIFIRRSHRWIMINTNDNLAVDLRRSETKIKLIRTKTKRDYFRFF